MCISSEVQPVVRQVSEAHGVHRSQDHHAHDPQHDFGAAAGKSQRAMKGVVDEPQAGEKEHERQP
jgi:hypothetical protein